MTGTKSPQGFFTFLYLEMFFLWTLWRKGLPLSQAGRDLSVKSANILFASLGNEIVFNICRGLYTTWPFIDIG